MVTEMLSLLSKRISLFLCGNHVIEKEEIEIYQYGFEIILSSLIGFILSIAVGCCLGMFFYALLYYGIFFIYLYTSLFLIYQVYLMKQVKTPNCMINKYWHESHL